MALLHVCTLGTLSASLAAAALLWLLPLGDVLPPRTTSSSVPVAAAMAISSAPSGLSEQAHQRTLAPSVIGRVLDPDGLPVAGMQVAMTGTKDVVESQSDGSFTFCTNDRGRCRVLAPPGWLAIESPLLDLCASEQAPDLIVARSGRPQGRVCDPEGVPLAGARVAVALHVKLPRQVRLGTMPSTARSASIYGEWSGATDADGWYFLPPSPVGERAQLMVEHQGFETARLDLETANGLRRVTLQPAATAGSNVASHGPSQPGVGIDGWLLDDEEQPRSGWWVAAVLEADDGEGLGLWGRFAQAPVRAAADGSFAFHGLRAGSYRIEAWQPQNCAVVRSQPIAAPESQLRLCLEESRLPGHIRGRVLDANGMPIRDAKAGLARPSGWAVPGHLAMQVQSIVATDRDGNFEIATQGFAALELIVAGAAVVPQRVTLADRNCDQRLDLRATPRRWLVMHRGVETPEHSVPALMEHTSLGSTSLASTLTAHDARDRALPMWLGGSPLVRPSCHLSGADAFGFPANSHSLVLRRGKREVARLYLRP